MIVTGESVNSMVDKLDEKKMAEDDPFVPSRQGATKNIPMDDKPFFIMDWLEKIIPKDLEIAQQFLYTPNKQTQPTDAKQLLEGSFPRELFTPSSPPKCESTMASSSHREKSYFYKKSVTIGNAWNAKGLQKAQKDHWDEALLCWQNALEVRLQILGEDHLDVANTYNNIGIAQGKIGSYAEAIDSLGRAQAIRSKQLGEEHTEVAATLHNIGNVHQQSGNFAKAVEFFALSKQLQETHLGKNHVQVARASIAIGHAHFQAGEWVKSREAYTGAMESLLRYSSKEEDDEVKHLKEDLLDVEAELNRLA